MKKNKLNKLKRQLDQQEETMHVEDRESITSQDPSDMEAPTASATSENYQDSDNFTKRDWLALGISVLFLGLLAFLSLKYFDTGSFSLSDKVRNLQDSIANAVDSQRGETSSTATSSMEESNNEDKTTEEQTTNAQGDVSSQNQIATTSQYNDESTWTATDYNQGDIEKGDYTVQEGDTLWEIAEAVYGNGAEWVQILQANASDIGQLPSGQQALIVPGQILHIN